MPLWLAIFAGNTLTASAFTAPITAVPSMRIYLNPNTGRFFTSDGDGYGDNEDPLSLHKYLYAECDPVDNTDPTGLFTQAFGDIAHDLIAGRYLAEHPGTIINPTTGVLGVLKPDIFNGPARVYAEIKPLSFKGIGEGWLQIETYDLAYGKLGFHRETAWPGGFQAAYVTADPIAYFNVDGIIFYSDAVDDIKDLKQIKDPASAYRVLRGLVNKSFSATRDVARQLVKGIAGEEEADIEDTEGIATLDSELGAP
jgi:hypothetical protein